MGSCLIIGMAIFMIATLRHQTAAIGSLNGRILGSKGRAQMASLIIREIIFQFNGYTYCFYAKLNLSDKVPCFRQPCCKARTAQCIACALCVTVDAYCREFPQTLGCKGIITVFIHSANAFVIMIYVCIYISPS